MALKKTITKPDGTSGDYIRLAEVILPSFTAGQGWGSGQLVFDVFKDKPSANQGLDPVIQGMRIYVPTGFFAGMDIANPSDTKKDIYDRAANIPGLGDSAAS